MNEVCPKPPKDPALLTAWLERAPAHVAAAWVSSQQAKDRSSSPDDLFPENALKTLKTRDDRFLDLALALHGDDDDVLRELWATSDPAIQRAIVCNQNRDRHWLRLEEAPGFLTPEGFNTFLAEADTADLKAFVTNPSFRGDNLSAVYERTGYYAELPDDRWRYIAVVALMDPNLHSEFREDRYAVDPFRKHEENRPKSLAFRLLFEVPAEQSWASRLEDGYSRFPDLDPPIQSPKEIDLLTKEGQEEFRAWRAQANREFLERAFERWTLKDEDKSRAQLTPVGSAGLRMVLASKVPSYNRDLRDWLEKHEDKWVRIGAASTKDFYTSDDVREWYERDGWAFLDAVSSNPSLHRRSKPAVVSEVRSLLERDDAAEAQGYHWEDTQCTRWVWLQKAERLHALDPRLYLSWDEDPELPGDGATREDPMLGALQKLEQRLDNISRTSSSDQQPVLEAVVTLSQMLSAFEEASRTRESRLQEDTARMSEGIPHMFSEFRQILSRLGGRTTIALVLIIVLGVTIAFR